MNPYRRKITVGKDGLSDIYDVLAAFGVTCPATQHAVKKLLIPGVRTGGKSKVKDLEEAAQAVQRAVELSKAYTNQELNCPPKTPGTYTWSECGHPVLVGELYCSKCAYRELTRDGKPPVYPLDEVHPLTPKLCDRCGLTPDCDCLK